MYSREQVQEWIQWSRESLPETGYYPLLDVSDIQRTTCPWQNEIYDAFSHSDKESREELFALFENQLSRDPADMSSRFTALNLHYALSTHANDNPELKGHYEYVGVDHEAVQEDFARKLAYLVRRLPVENCTDWRTIRWEICNACAIRDWDRAGKLHNQLEALDLREPAERQILRGQFNFFVALGSKTCGNFNPLFWEPKLRYSKRYEPLDSQEIYAPFLLFSLGLVPAREREEDETETPLDGAERDRMSDAANDFDKGLSKRPGLSLAYRSMLAGSYFAKGDFWNAAKNYEQVLVASDSNISVGGKIKITIFQCIAKSYQLAGDAGKATDVLERCAEEFRSAKGIYKQLARIQVQATKPELALESWIKESERDEVFGEDPLASTLLALGRVGRDIEQLAALVKTDLSSNPPLNEGLESLVKAHWPSVDDLTPAAREEWICGSRMLLIPSVQERTNRPMSRAAATQFGKAVELELKSRVFGKFRGHVAQSSDLQTLREKRNAWRKDAPFCRFLVSQKPLTLGEIYSVLKHCGKSDLDMVKKFKDWVQENWPPLLYHKNLKELQRILDIRNPATHPATHGGSVSVEKLESMPHLCRKFLSALLPSPRHGTS